jgi:pepF/M3 family oligoendopeptidase
VVSETALPRWDLSNIYPSPTSPEYLEAVTTLRARLDAITATFDEYGIGLPDGAHPHADPERIIADWLALYELADLLDNYLYCWTSSDSNDAEAAAAFGELDMLTARESALEPRLTTWLASLDPSSAAADSLVARHHYRIERAKFEARHLMSPELEELAATLQATGGTAWVRVRDETDASLKATIERDGVEVTVSLTELESDFTSPDREKRSKAAEAEARTLESAAHYFAAALNAIKGEALTLSQRRKWDSPLDWSLFYSAIDRETLEAMFAAQEAAHGELHRYLQTKAKLLGLDRLAHYDLLAPVGRELKKMTWAECESITRSVLDSFSPRLSRVIRTAFDNRWIDAEPRDGKVGGGYCAAVGPYGSRILVNFVPAFPTVQTLAHELGHAHHNDCLAERTGLQLDTPMTLAETASMFCQRLAEEAVLANSDPDEQIAALGQMLNEAVSTIIDLHARFHFEQAVFELRANRTLGVGELTDLMRSAQQVAYGAGLDPEQTYQWQWVAKPHYYDTEYHFYNYPYQFGMLLALGLLKVYRDQPDGFAERYENLLSRTGMATAWELASDFGIDIRDRAFWDGSIAVIRSDVDRYISLAEAQLST